MLKNVTSKYSISLALLDCRANRERRCWANSERVPHLLRRLVQRSKLQTRRPPCFAVLAISSMRVNGRKRRRSLSITSNRSPTRRVLNPRSTGSHTRNIKLGRYDQMRATIDRLLQKYPNTTWREDARLLTRASARALTYAIIRVSLPRLLLRLNPVVLLRSHHCLRWTHRGFMRPLVLWVR